MTRNFLLSLAVCAAAMTAGCEKTGGAGSGFSGGGGSSSGGSSGGGGGDNSAAVGVWKCFKYDAPGEPMGKAMYWIFKSDGTFSLNSSSAWTDVRSGTYKMNGNKITGNGKNSSAPAPHTMQINFTVNGNTLTGVFHEDWGGGKNIDVGANKQ